MTTQQFIIENWLVISGLLYEIIVRLVPTKYDLSILNKIFQLADFIIPNLKTVNDPLEVVQPKNKKAKFWNLILNILSNKHKLSIVFLFLSFGASAQIWQNFKGIRLVNITDSTLIVGNPAYEINGAVYYNIQSNKFRAYQNNQWVDLIGTGGGSGGSQYWGRFNAIIEGVSEIATAAANKAAVDAAILAAPVGTSLVFPGGIYACDPFTINKDVDIVGLGTTLMSGTVGSTTPHISITASGVSIWGINMIGNGRTGIAQAGILISGCSLVRLENVSVKDFNGYGIKTLNTNVGTLGINIVNVTVTNNLHGIFHDTRGEYVNVTGVTATANTINVYTYAGNITYSGGNITAALGTGVYILTGANDNHSIFNGVQINHNAVNIDGTGIVNGVFFEGCNIYAGNINFLNSANVTFNSCRIGTTVNMNFNNTRGCKIENCTIIDIANTITETPANSVLKWFNTTPSNISLSGFSSKLLLPALGGANGFPSVNYEPISTQPSTLVNGDVWVNSATQILHAQLSNTTRSVLMTQGALLSSGRVPFASIGTVLTDDAGFTFNTSGDILTTGRLVSLSTATLPGVNVGSFAGDPSTLTNGDKWYNSSLNQNRTRKNGVTYDEITALNGLQIGTLPYMSGVTSTITSEQAFSYDDSSNTLVVNNAAGTNVTSIIGGASFRTSTIPATFNTDYTLSGIATNQSSYVITNNGGNINLQPTANDVRINNAPLIGNTYTPTLTNVSNINTSAALGTFNFQRINNIVFVTGTIAVEPTAGGTPIVLELTVPYTSAFTTAFQASGTAASETLGSAGTLSSVPGDTLIELNCTTNVVHSTMNISVSFSYQILP